MKLEEVDNCTEIDEKFIKVLKILMNGKTVKIGNTLNLGLAKTINNGLSFYLFYDDVDRVFGIENFPDVYNYIKNVSDEDIMIMLGEIVLKQHKIR